MSPVLRPFRATAQPHKEIENNHVDTNNDLLNSLANPVIQQSDTMHVSDIAVNQVSENKVSAQEQEDEKEEKISKVLQELLDRKIEKTIESAEAALAVPVDEVTKETSEAKEGVGDNHEIRSDNSPYTTTEPPLPLHVEQTQSKSLVTGQEIHVALPSHEAILPAVSVAESSVAVEQDSMLPSEQRTHTLLPDKEDSSLLAQATNDTSLPAQQTPQQKIHWFDKLFGSIPPSPSQS